MASPREDNHIGGFISSFIRLISFIGNSNSGNSGSVNNFIQQNGQNFVQQDGTSVFLTNT